MFRVKLLFFQGEQGKTRIKKETELVTVPWMLLGLTVVLILTGLIDLDTLWFLTMTFTALMMLFCVGKGPPRTDLVSLLLPPLVLGSILLPTVPLDVALETISGLVLIALGTLLSIHFEVKSLEKFIPVLINILGFMFGIATVYRGAIAIVVTLTSVMAMSRNVTESIKAIDKAIERVFQIAVRLAELLDIFHELGADFTNLLISIIVEIIDSPFIRFVYVPAMSVVVTLVPRAPAHVTFVSMVFTSLSSLLLIFYQSMQRDILKRPAEFIGIISVIVNVALILVNSFSVPPFLVSNIGLCLLFATNVQIQNLMNDSPNLSLWEIYCVLIRPHRCTDCFTLFFPEFLVFITMMTEGCSPFAIYTITLLTVLTKRIYTRMLWNYSSSKWITLLIYFIQFLILLLVVSNIRAIYGGLLALLVRFLIATKMDQIPIIFVPLLLALFVMGTTSFFIIVLMVIWHVILIPLIIFFTSRIVNYLTIFFITYLASGILIAGATSQSTGLIFSITYFMLLCIFAMSFESKVWALMLTAGLGVGLWLTPAEQIGIVELVALAFLISIIAETNTAPWPKQCSSE